MSPLDNHESANRDNNILFLDFYRSIKEGDIKYIQKLISTLFGDKSSLKIESGDLSTSLKVTGNIFEINRLRDAFSKGVGLNTKKLIENLVATDQLNSAPPGEPPLDALKSETAEKTNMTLRALLKEALRKGEMN